MYCKSLFFSRHAFERMFQRDLMPDIVAAVISDGVTIKAYPDDCPFPSELILGFDASRAIHVVVAQDTQTDHCHVVTVYLPSPDIWDETFKFRRTS